MISNEFRSPIFLGSTLLLSFICLSAMGSGINAPTLNASARVRSLSEEGPTVKEPESGVLFPVQLENKALSKGFEHPTTKVPASLGNAVLTGVGVREKTMFMVDVYAMGLYLEPIAARLLLAEWKGKSAKELQGDGAFYTRLLNNGIPTTLRLVMCRDVDGEDMAEAFDESLGPRMRKVLDRGKKYLPAGSRMGSVEDLKRFRAFFKMDEVKEGVELLFTWDKDGVLYTRVAGKPVGTITSHALSQSLFDIFLGDDPISEDGKKSMVIRTPGLLKPAAAK